MNICRRSRIGAAAQLVKKGRGPFLTKGLQSAARIICSLKANKFHTCRPRSVFCDVHAAAKNGLHFICRLRAANSARLFCPLLWIRRAEAFDQNGPVKWKYWKKTEKYTEYSWKIFPITSYASPLAANKHKCACTADGISGAEKGRLTFWRICTARTQSQETVREISTKNNGSFITVT